MLNARQGVFIARKKAVHKCRNIAGYVDTMVNRQCCSFGTIYLLAPVFSSYLKLKGTV
jgi:hypothetical protein